MVYSRRADHTSSCIRGTIQRVGSNFVDLCHNGKVTSIRIKDISKVDWLNCNTCEDESSSSYCESTAVNPQENAHLYYSKIRGRINNLLNPQGRHCQESSSSPRPPESSSFCESSSWPLPESSSSCPESSSSSVPPVESSSSSYQPVESSSSFQESSSSRHHCESSHHRTSGRKPRPRPLPHPPGSHHRSHRQPESSSSSSVSSFVRVRQQRESSSRHQQFESSSVRLSASESAEINNLSSFESTPWPWESRQNMTESSSHSGDQGIESLLRRHIGGLVQVCVCRSH